MVMIVINLKWSSLSLKDAFLRPGPTRRLKASISYITLMLQNTVYAIQPNPVTDGRQND